MKYLYQSAQLFNRVSSMGTAFNQQQQQDGVGDMSRVHSLMQKNVLM